MVKATRLATLTALAFLLSVAPSPAAVTFTEVGESAGVRLVHDSLGFRIDTTIDVQNLYGPGVGIEDVNNDGWLDLFVSNGEAGNRMFLNNGDWTFTDASTAMRVGTSKVANGVAFGDLDNDGLMDFTLGNFFSQPQLYKHQQDSFTDFASLGGLIPLIPHEFLELEPESMGVSYADYDQDGFLDIYIANYRDQQDVLYESRGGTYWQYNDSVQVTYTGYGFQAVFLDFDDDGDLDIYVANDFGYNFLFVNQGREGDFAFEEVALSYGVAGGGTSTDPKGMSMGLAVGDYDNDLDLDIFVTNFQLNSFYRNDGPGSRPKSWNWVEVARPLGVEYPINCWGTDFVDLDNDTDLDLVQASGWIYEFRFNQPKENPDQVWLNDGPANNYRFTNITEGSGFGSTQMARGLATGDLDRDGDVDVAIVNNTYYSPTPNAPDPVVYEGYSQLYRNDQDHHENNWLNLRLEGSFGRVTGAKSNRSAVGARAWVTTTDGLTMMREVQAGASFMSHNSMELEFGLGQAEVSSVRVRWPGGSEQTWTDVAANRYWVLQELDPVARPLSFALNSFAAERGTEGVRFTWWSAPSARVVTATLERRVDGGAWSAIVVLEGAAANSGEVWDDAPPAQGMADYRLVLTEDDDLQTVSGVSSFQFGDGNPPVPTAASLGQNYPNPFNPTTRIEFELTRAERAVVRIFDPRGRLVRTLFEGEGVAGSNFVDWDGTNDEGDAVASGVYQYQLETPTKTDARRMVLVR